MATKAKQLKINDIRCGVVGWIVQILNDHGDVVTRAPMRVSFHGKSFFSKKGERIIRFRGHTNDGTVGNFLTPAWNYNLVDFDPVSEFPESAAGLRKPKLKHAIFATQNAALRYQAALNARTVSVEEFTGTLNRLTMESLAKIQERIARNSHVGAHVKPSDYPALTSQVAAPAA